MKFNNLILELAFFLFLIYPVNSFSTKITIDADGKGANYTSLDTAIMICEKNKNYPDTFLFIGDDQDIYPLSQNFGSMTSDTFAIIGQNDNPDLFPVIDHKGGEECFNWFSNNKLYFEKILFTGNTKFKKGAKAHLLTFKRCVFKDYNSSLFIQIDGDQTGAISFENCLFVNNSFKDGVIFFNFWADGHSLSIVNCTFDGNAKLFNTQDRVSKFVLKNCIFSNGDTIFPYQSLKAKTTYSLTSEKSLTGYGTGCKSGDAGFKTASNRSKPSDWKLLSNSSASAIGTSSGAPLIDIAGNVRTGFDAGCWAINYAAILPVITKEPDSVKIGEGRNVKFKVDASGSDLKYAWFRTGKTDTLGKLDSLLLLADTSLNGALYFCKVLNAGGTVTSKSALLTVLKKPSITQNIKDTTVNEGTAFVYKIKATGSEFKYQWYRNNVVIAGQTSDSLLISSADTSRNGDTLFCIVFNSFDTVTSVKAIVTVLPNKAPAISKEPDSLTVVNLSQSLSLSVTATGTGVLSYVWYKNGLTDSVGNSPVFSISAAILADSGSYQCIVKNSIGTVKSRVAKVRVVDSSVISNPVKLSGKYIGSDSVMIDISGLSAINKDSCDYLVISYGNQNVQYGRDTIDIQAIGLGVDSIIKVYRNDLFVGNVMNITFNVKIVGIHGKGSSENSIDVTVGIKLPDNNAILNADSVYGDKVDLSWTIPDTDKIDSICIWYGKESIPLFYKPDTSKFRSQRLSGTIRSLTVDKLDYDMEYYFALQIKSGPFWSSITYASSDSARTLTGGDTTRIINAIIIKGNPSFNSSKNTISITWIIDTSKSGKDSFKIGINWALDTFPDTLSVGGVGKIIPYDSVSLTKENVTELYLGNDQFFDVNYFFSLYMKRADSRWSKKSDNAQVKIKIPPVQWQEMEYFDNCDSVSVLNNSLMIRKGSLYPSDFKKINRDTIDLVSALVIPDGFISVSKSFKFRNSSNFPQVELGYRYDSIPAGYSYKDIFMYEYNDGKWYLLDRVATNTQAKMVFSVLNSPFNNVDHKKCPHILMIDTIKPKVDIFDTSLVLEVSSDIIIRFKIEDNIFNANYQLKCAQIDKKLVTIDESILNSNLFEKVATTTYQQAGLSESNSLRMILIVSDGAHTDTFDISRQIRKTNESVTSKDLQWIPVSTTTVLETPGVENALVGLCKANQWLYDSLQFRLFYWDPMSQNKDNCYIQYTQNSSFFNMIPGRVFWVKSRSQRPIKFGIGKTVSIREPFKVTLQAKQWTDFSMPFNIDLYIADIFDSSPAITGNQKDSVWFFRFDALNSKGKLQCTPIYYPVIQEYSSKLAILKNEMHSSYTIYNANDKNVEIVIPPIDTINSRQQKVAHKKTLSRQWYLTINAETEEDIIAPVFCGFSDCGTGISTLPSPPAPGAVGVNICDTTDFSKHGNVIYHEERYGFRYPLVISNKSSVKRKIVNYSINSDILKKYGLSAGLFNSESNQFERNVSDLSVSLAPGESAYRWVLVGDSTYFNNWLKGFANISFALTSVNVCHSHLVNINYSVPYSGVSSVKFRIVNQLGQVIYSKLCQNVKPGKNIFNWDIGRNGKLACGYYIVQLSGYNSDMKLTNTLQGRFLYLPR